MPHMSLWRAGSSCRAVQLLLASQFVQLFDRNSCAHDGMEGTTAQTALVRPESRLTLLSSSVSCLVSNFMHPQHAALYAAAAAATLCLFVQVESLGSRRDVEVVQVTKANRDRLVADLCQRIQAALKQLPAG